MKKSIAIAFLFFTLIVLSLNLIQAYHYDGRGYDYGMGYGSRYSDDYYKKTTTHKETETSSNRGRYGYERTTRAFTETITIERRDYPRAGYKIICSDYHYYTADGKAVYNSGCGNFYTSSSWRYKPDYRYSDYGKDDYRKPYYYQQMYDRDLGYYNWRY